MGMSEHTVAVTTHTTELRQISEMNAALRRHPGAVTAGTLGLGWLPAGLELRRLEAAGPPSYPYVYGVFAGGAEQAGAGHPAELHTAEPHTAELHTAQLRTISALLALRGHAWGV
jgi:hypothetical protein